MSKAITDKSPILQIWTTTQRKETSIPIQESVALEREITARRHITMAMDEHFLQDLGAVSSTTTILEEKSMCQSGRKKKIDVWAAILLTVFFMCSVQSFAMTEVELAKDVQKRNRQILDRVSVETDEAIEQFTKKSKEIIRSLSVLEEKCENQIGKRRKIRNEETLIILEKMNVIQESVDYHQKKILRRKDSAEKMVKSYCQGNFQSNINDYIDCQYKFLKNSIMLDMLIGIETVSKSTKFMSNARREVISCWKRNGVDDGEVLEIERQIEIESKLNKIYQELFSSLAEKYFSLSF